MPPTINISKGNTYRRQLYVKTVDLATGTITKKVYGGIFNNRLQFEAYVKTEFVECREVMQRFLNDVQSIAYGFRSHTPPIYIVSIKPSNTVDQVDFTFNATTAQNYSTYSVVVGIPVIQEERPALYAVYAYFANVDHLIMYQKQLYDALTVKVLEYMKTSMGIEAQLDPTRKITTSSLNPTLLHMLSVGEPFDMQSL